MSVVSFALAVVFIIRLFSTSAFRVPKTFLIAKIWSSKISHIFGFSFLSASENACKCQKSPDKYYMCLIGFLNNDVRHADNWICPSSR